MSNTLIQCSDCRFPAAPNDAYCCKKCLVCVCARCVLSEACGYYCPQCLRLYTSNQAQLLFNQCQRCFQCPMCFAPAQIAQVGDKQKLFCSFCKYSNFDELDVLQAFNTHGVPRGAAWSEFVAQRIAALQATAAEAARRNKPKKPSAKYVKGLARVQKSLKVGKPSEPFSLERRVELDARATDADADGAERLSAALRAVDLERAGAAAPADLSLRSRLDQQACDIGAAELRGGLRARRIPLATLVTRRCAACQAIVYKPHKQVAADHPTVAELNYAASALLPDMQLSEQNIALTNMSNAPMTVVVAAPDGDAPDGDAPATTLGSVDEKETRRAEFALAGAAEFRCSINKIAVTVVRQSK